MSANPEFDSSVSDHYAVWKGDFLFCSCGCWEYDVPVPVTAKRVTFEAALARWRLHALEHDRPMEFALLHANGVADVEHLPRNFRYNPYRA